MAVVAKAKDELGGSSQERKWCLKLEIGCESIKIGRSLGITFTICLWPVLIIKGDDCKKKGGGSVIIEFEF